MEGAASYPLAEQIRDIQLPVEPSLWPLAPGWWLLLLVLVVIAVFGLVWGYRGRALRRGALKELARLQHRYEVDGDPAGLAMGVSILLRRVALAREPRYRVAGLCGDDWLDYLDRRGNTHQFTTGPGRLLVSLPYRPEDGADVPAMLALVRRWLRLNS